MAPLFRVDPALVLVTHPPTRSHLCVDALVLEVDDVHLLADALQRRLCAQGRHVGADVPMRVAGDRLQVDLGVQLHVLGVDAHHLKAAWESRVGSGRVGSGHIISKRKPARYQRSGFKIWLD